MRPTVPILCAALLTLPTAAALFEPELGGEIAVRARIAQILPCEEPNVPAFLDIRPRDVPEVADLTLDTETDCGAPLLSFEGRLEPWGWRLGDGEVTRGALRRIDAVSWHLRLETTACPATAHCPLPIAHMVYEGILGPVYAPQ